ncbi:hypothetical protein BDB00DRAFT_848223 [Zychaea mexicana]|uniref:uncharacterized protein n=1 Tax=Zychaea mexicana TaxID=64656 RepID=UPI0022FEC3A6|nr:uncharacterized protein BDB00DRAFT_848223 [Zychaea mexicana]KAI9488382.1 hypothetical protein BDB00DRAFT_848223 [Zychaea mexicana]
MNKKRERCYCSLVWCLCVCVWVGVEYRLIHVYYVHMASAFLFASGMLSFLL